MNKIKAIVSDFSRVILFPKDTTYGGSLNELHQKLSKNLGYNILDYFYLNQELLDFYKSFQDDMGVYVFTSENIQEDPNLTSYLEPAITYMYSAREMGVNKQEVEAYVKMAGNLGYKPEEVLYIDDSAENIKIVANAGMKVIQYTGNQDLFSKIEKELQR